MQGSVCGGAGGGGKWGGENFLCSCLCFHLLPQALAQTLSLANVSPFLGPLQISM